MRTRLTEMLGIEHPVMLAGMGGVSFARLVAAVSDAGGFGTLGAATMTTEELSSEMQQVRDLTAAPFGVDLLAALPERMVAGATSPMTTAAAARRASVSASTPTRTISQTAMSTSRSDRRPHSPAVLPAGCQPAT